MLKIWTRPKFCSLGYFCKLHSISLYFKPLSKQHQRGRERHALKTLLEKEEILLIQIFSPFPTMLSIPTSLKQVSPFRKELTYIIDSVQK